MRAVTRGLVVLLLPMTAGLNVGLAACSSGDSGSGAEAVADDLATGLAAKDLEALPWTHPDTEVDLTAILGSLADDQPKVEVDKVDDQGGTATATLSWSWDLDGRTWAYDTTADLVDTGGRWTVTWDPSIVESSLKKGESFDVDTLLPERGDILGAGGKPLVTERDVVHYGLDKTKVSESQVAGSARKIAVALGIDPASYTKRAQAAGPKAYVEAIVLRLSDVGTVPSTYDDIPGAVALSGTLPLAPSKEFAAPILGTVGPATAEIIKESKGKIEAGDVVGLSGLEARYDEQLRGTPGVSVDAVNAKGRRTHPLFTAKPVDGKSLTITLDEQLQLKAERILAGFGGEAPPNATAIVAIRPSTGDILAAANGPGTGGQNIATFGQYAPGSTMKIVSSLALLRSGLTPTSRVSCPATVTVNGKEFKNYDDYPASKLGRITLRDAIANSCNTAVIGQRERLRGSALADAAAALGLGVDHDLGFPAYFGQVPPTDSETEGAADLIGQGKVLASPMTMAVVAASVAAGHAVLPRLVPSATAAQKPPAKPLTKTEASQLRGLMRAVVTDGSGHLLADLPGQVGAKTGTAEYGEPAPDGSLPTHTWMIATQGDLAVAVFVETGESGSGTAGPLLESFLR